MGQRKVMQGLLPRIAVGVFGLLTVGMLLLAVFDPHGALAVRKQHAKRDQVTSDVASLSKENEQLKKEIDSLRHDPAMIERIAREQLKLVKPGEIILVTPAPAKN
jgi:cell division protein FtsB